MPYGVYKEAVLKTSAFPEEVIWLEIGFNFYMMGNMFVQMYGHGKSFVILRIKKVFCGPYCLHK